MAVVAIRHHSSVLWWFAEKHRKPPHRRSEHDGEAIDRGASLPMAGWGLAHGGELRFSSSCDT